MNIRKHVMTASLLFILFIGMSACSNTSEQTTVTNPSETENTSESTSDSSQSNSSTDSTVKSESNSEETSNEDSKSQEEVHVEEDNTSKIEGRRSEFIGKLDNIQKELDAMPEKKASDQGVTNAMKNYYGLSYEEYDKALNEIYGLLQNELSPDTMKELKSEQIEWIEQKEKMANEERLTYEGGTFENVAYYISLYESTKERCYELVNLYMTDEQG